MYGKIVTRSDNEVEIKNWADKWRVWRRTNKNL